MPGTRALTSAATAERRQQNAERRLMRRDEAVALLKTKSYIHTAHDAIDVLLKGYEKQIDTSTGAELVVPLDRGRIQAIKGSADIALRLLAKVLPDVKAIEMSQDPANSDPRHLTTEQLLNLIESVRPGSIVDGDFTEIPTPENNNVSTSEPGW